ncbi:hypothetical protein KIW84_020149 [Lathyrus oleraceus]|uniref:Uncharacterized protein n=1 Tax=Pisum sativum TaxID=3888 RepID=A0A9D4Y8W3_PEA|nr:hypothetical protein KIW84_020149 [Pisum sativum]
MVERLVLLTLVLLFTLLLGFPPNMITSHLGFPIKNMKYPRPIPNTNPHPYPIATGFHLNPSFSSSQSLLGEGGECCSGPHCFDNGNPHSSKFPSYDSFENVLNCFPLGISPTRWLLERFKTSRLLRFVNSEGIIPINIFEERSNHSKFVKFPMDCGM